MKRMWWIFTDKKSSRADSRFLRISVVIFRNSNCTFFGGLRTNQLQPFNPCPNTNSIMRYTLKYFRLLLFSTLSFVFIVCSSDDSPTTPAKEEESTGNENLLIIEPEELSLGNGWRIETKFPCYTGESYIRWDGNDNFGNPGVGLTSTSLSISKPEIYRFMWHNKIGHGTNSTESNDTWLRFPNASDFYGKRTRDGKTTYVFPHGSGKSPTPHGTGKDGWFKVYSSGTTDWTWNCYTSDNDAHLIYVEFDEAGEYLLQFSGRSKHHCLDRIALYHSDMSEAEAMVRLRTIE